MPAPQSLLNDLMQAALEAAKPEHQLQQLKLPPVKGRTLVLGAGKASAAMAQAFDWIDPETLDKARSLELNPEAFLDNNDAHSFFQQMDQAIITGPTLTNVNDFRALLIL